MKTVGIDWDNINIYEAIARKTNIEKIEKIPTMLFRTKNGYHIKLYFNREISVEENFKIRKKYDDCKQRLEYSTKRYEATGNGHDILFNMKKNHWRELIG